jgi:hypothetical protein
MARSILPPSKPPGSPVRMLLVQAGCGALLGLAFAITLAALDVHGIGALIGGSDEGVMTFLVLAAGFMVTGGSVVAGTAVMTMRDDDDDRDGGHAARHAIPVRVSVGSARRSSPVQGRFH